MRCFLITHLTQLYLQLEKRHLTKSWARENSVQKSYAGFS
jgi:hypothetical protein